MDETKNVDLIEELNKELENVDVADIDVNINVSNTTIEDESKHLTEDEIERLVKQDIELAKNYQKQFLIKWRELYKLYKAQIDPKYNVEGRAKITCADVMDTIEWVMPSLMRIFVGSDDVVVIQPVGAEDVQSAELMQKLINFQFNYKMNGFLHFYTWFKEALLYGTGVIKISWGKDFEKKNFYYEELTEEEFNELNNNPKVSIESFDVYEEVEKTLSPEGIEIEVKTIKYKNVKGFIKKIIYEGPVLETIPITSFYIEPGARSIKEANFVAHRTIRTMDYLRRMQREGVYHNVDRVIPNENLDLELLEITDPFQTEVKPLDSLNNNSSGREKVEVWECWVKLDIDGDGLLEPLLVTIANGTIIRCEENPFDHGEPPFEVLVPIIDLHKFYGISLAELVAEFQKIKTAIIRLLLDNFAFTTNKMFLVQRNAGVDLNSLRSSRPGGIVLTDNLNGIRELGVSPLPPYVFNLLEYLEVLKEARSGVSRFQQGLDPRSISKTTATGITAVLSSAQQRLELIARLFAETGVKRLFRKLISLNQQFLSQDLVIRIFDQELQITPDMLDGSFDLLVNVGVGAGLKEVQAQKMIQLLNIMPSLAQVGLVKPEHIYNVVKELLKSMGIKDIDKYIQLPQQQMQNIPKQLNNQKTSELEQPEYRQIISDLIPPQATGGILSPFSLPKRQVK